MSIVNLFAQKDVEIKITIYKDVHKKSTLVDKMQGFFDNKSFIFNERYDRIKK